MTNLTDQTQFYLNSWLNPLVVGIYLISLVQLISIFKPTVNVLNLACTIFAEFGFSSI